MWPPFRLLRIAVAILTLVRSCKGSSSHSLQYFYTGVSDAGQGLSQFIALGYVNGGPFVRYDSNARKMVPQVSWIKEAEKEDPHYWKRNTQNAQETELVFRESIKILRGRYNQTGGIHTWQMISGCELRGDGSTGSYYQHSYNGEDFITFDKENLTWTAANTQALVTKRKWENYRAWSHHMKSYLEEECIEWLQKYLRYGNETLLRKEQPKVKVTSRADHDNMETLICRVDGFYPRDIEAVWTRDGEVWEQETLCGLVTPNSDGTYHTWISIKVDPKDKDHFQCRVDHSSLSDPVDFVVGEFAFNLWIIISCFALGIVLPVTVFNEIFLVRKCKSRRPPGELLDSECDSVLAEKTPALGDRQVSLDEGSCSPGLESNESPCSDSESEEESNESPRSPRQDSMESML